MRRDAVSYVYKDFGVNYFENLAIDEDTELFAGILKRDATK